MSPKIPGKMSASPTDVKQRRDSKIVITKQKNRISALKSLLAYYKEITETIREPFIILDKHLFVVTANLAFYHKFKVSKKDTEGTLIYELGDNQWDSLGLRLMLEKILPAHRVLNNYEVTHDFPTLGRKTMLLNARQVDSKQLILLAIEDITPQKKFKTDTDEMTKNLTKQRDQLQGLSDAKDEFISLASHQLRTPATVVKQYVGMLTNDYAGKVSSDQMDMLIKVHEGNERQLDIIEDLLRVAKVDAGKVYLDKSSCDLAQAVEAVIQEQVILFKSRGQRVVFNKPRKQVTAFIDQKLILMVLENILDNAGKYSPDGEQITINVEQNDGFASISIKDNGVGIGKDDYQKLFKKFSRIDNPLTVSVKGTGLGLYWAKKILDLHDGSIELVSKINGGSTFTIKLPTNANHQPKHAPKVTK